MSRKSDLIEASVQKEYKSVPAYLVKANAEQGITVIIANVFGIVDDGDDLIPNGALAKTISERFNRIRRLDQHRTDSVMRVIGKVLAIREVGRDELPDDVLRDYPEATGGLEVTTQYLMDTPEGLGAFRRVAAGAVNEYSIGFDLVDRPEYRKMTWRGKEINVRVLKQLRLWEVSDVIFGMNPATTTTSVKEMTADGPVTRLGDYLYGSIRRTANCVTDDFLTCGYVNQEEHQVIVNAVNVALDTFTITLPESVALMPLSSYWGFGWMASVAEQEMKQLSAETKEGRTISAANAARLQAAYDALTEIMVSAGLITPPEDEPADQEEPDEIEMGGTPDIGITMMNATSPGEPHEPTPFSEQSEHDDALLDNPDIARAEPSTKETLTPDARARMLADIQREIQALGG